MQERPLILTLQLDERLFAALDALRTAHFPAERNLVPAHITLFHALPGAHEPQIADELRELAAGHAPLPLAVPTLRFLGRGVALEVESPQLSALRGELAQRWWDWLSPQDRQRYKPHVTIQNKQRPELARALFDSLSESWQPLSGLGAGLLLWRYLGGPWELAASVPLGR